jgi:hypothetical protein
MLNTCSEARIGLIIWQVRENHTKNAAELDLDDILLVEGPAKGAHNGMFSPLLETCFTNRTPDVTAASGPRMINNYVPLDVLDKYPISQFRYRIVK